MGYIWITNHLHPKWCRKPPECPPVRVRGHPRLWDRRVLGAAEPCAEAQLCRRQRSGSWGDFHMAWMKCGYVSTYNPCKPAPGVKMQICFICSLVLFATLPGVWPGGSSYLGGCTGLFFSEGFPFYLILLTKSLRSGTKEPDASIFYIYIHTSPLIILCKYGGFP